MALAGTPPTVTVDEPCEVPRFVPQSVTMVPFAFALCPCDVSLFPLAGPSIRSMKAMTGAWADAGLDSNRTRATTSQIIARTQTPQRVRSDQKLPDSTSVEAITQVRWSH